MIEYPSMLRRIYTDGRDRWVRAVLHGYSIGKRIDYTATALRRAGSGDLAAEDRAPSIRAVPLHRTTRPSKDGSPTRRTRTSCMTTSPPSITL
jgi:hypothetical protein